VPGLILSLFFSAQLWAQSARPSVDFNDEDQKFLFYVYRQQERKEVDPLGDVALLSNIQWYFKKITGSLRQGLMKTFEAYEEEKKIKVPKLLEKYPEFAPVVEELNVVDKTYIAYNLEDYPVQLEGKQDPFDPKKLTLMMKQVISEEFAENHLTPSEGRIHEWDPELKKKLKKKFPFFGRMSKLLIALACGVSYQYLRTDKEIELTQYILTRAQNSITIEEMFRQSYRLNQGDVYLSLLTIENVLSRYWTDSQRDQRAVTTRLKDITNYNYRTDKYGAWYHMFGMMVFGYSKGALRAKLVGMEETLASRVLDMDTDETQEDFVNSKSGKIGAELRRFVRKEGHVDFHLDKSYLHENFYMTLDEDFGKRIQESTPKKD
jgi:hypothetical protein